MKRNMLCKYLARILSIVIIGLMLLTTLSGILPAATPPVLAEEGEGDTGEVTEFSDNLTPDGDISLFNLSDFSDFKSSEGNPKLDYQLNQLVEAQDALDIMLFSDTPSENDTQPVIPETVQIVIECLPGQAETVIQSASGLGTFE